MTTRAVRRIRVVVTLAAAAAGARWATAAPPPFHAEPEVGIVTAAGSGSGSGTIVLRNDGSAAVVAAAITAEPGCDAPVHASPLTGFTLAAGATLPLAITCTPPPAGQHLQRCDYRVRSGSGAVLAELEAVCAYAGATTLSPDLASIDFGTVSVGSTASRTIALHDTAAAPIDRLFIDTTELAGNFTAQAPCNPDARECDAAIPAVPTGGSIALTVACTPRTPGPQAAELHIVTSAATRLAAPISLACVGAAATVPVISVAPTTIDVGAVELIGATAAATVHVANAGTDTLRLLDVQIVDAGTGAASDWTYTALAPCGAHVPPACPLTADQIGGQSVDLDLVFDPSAIGARDATLLINYHDTADRSISVPLHGAGRGATLDLVGGQTILDFGAVPLAMPSTLTVQVANHGTRDLTDAALTVMPAGPFTASPGPGVTVAANGRTTITVTCRPAVAGPATANLQLTAPDVQTAPIDLTLRCTGDPAMTVTATPPAVLLGEVRLATQMIAQVAVASLGGAVGLGPATLEAANPGMTVDRTPATTPATIDLTVSARADGDLADRILVTPASGPQLAVAITGAAVTATYSVPAAISLGTFCVQQPTTPRILPLASTGTATITIMAPALARGDSPFDVALVAPLLYPAALAPLQSALVAATPKRQTTPGLVTDDLLWKTDVAGATTASTTLTATFIDNGGAIAPHDLGFDAAPIHLDTRNAQQVTLRNCDVSPLELDPPVIPAPFTIDSSNFPDILLPGETATFSVGFHPTRLGMVTKTLVITSPQLRDTPLKVTLSGSGIAIPVGGGADAGTTVVDHDSKSFYTCGCASHGRSDDPWGAILLTIAAGCALVPRRRPRRQ